VDTKSRDERNPLEYREKKVRDQRSQESEKRSYHESFLWVVWETPKKTIVEGSESSGVSKKETGRLGGSRGRCVASKKWGKVRTQASEVIQGIPTSNELVSKSSKRKKGTLGAMGTCYGCGI